MLIFLTLTVWQHPLGTSIIIIEDKLLKATITAGVNVIVEITIGYPLIAIANEIGATVPPVEIAALAPNVTLNRALHWFVRPLKVTKPLPSLWTMELLPQTALFVNNIF